MSSAAARHNNRHRNMRSQVADCLNPIRGIRDQQRRAGKEPTDFARKHREALRAMESKNRDMKSKKADMVAKEKGDRFTLKKFEGVKSRLHSPTKSSEASATAAAAAAAEQAQAAKEGARGKSKTSYLSKGSGTRDKPKVTSPGQATPRKFVRATHGIAPKASVPSRHERGQLKAREDKNYVQSNFRTVKVAPPKKETPAEKQAAIRRRNLERKMKAGQVPKYLTERKKEWADAKARELEAAGDEDCPPGMKRLPDAERVQTLKLLQRTRTEQQKALDSMPLSVTTQSQIRRKNEVEAKLKEVEDAIKIFSKKKVFIRMDDDML